MTAGQSAAGRDVESINEEAVEAGAAALVMEQTGGLCDEWPRPCADCDCFRDNASTAAVYAARDLAQSRAVLAAALPLLRLSDVPGLERQLRDKIAGEIEAKRDADRSWRAFNFAERVNDTALLIAAQIARGSSS